MNECIHIDVFFDAINIIQSCNEHVHLAGCQVPMAELTELLPKRCRTLMNIFHLVGGLVAIFYFPIIILGIIIPIDGPYFSEGFKPPTSHLHMWRYVMVFLWYFYGFSMVFLTEI